MVRFSRMAILGLVVAGILLPSQPVAADDPEFNGRKMSEWLDLMQTDKLARKRRASVVALSAIISTNNLSDDDLNMLYKAMGQVMRNDTSEGVRAQAANSLGQIKADSGHAKNAADNMVEALRGEKDPSVRRELIAGVVRYAKFAEDAVRPLIALLKDSDPAIRVAAADALGRFAKAAKPAAPELLALLKDPEKSVQKAAVFALGRVEPDDSAAVANALIGVFKESTDKEMRLESLVALGILSDFSDASRETFVAVLMDPKEDLTLRRHAMVSLTRFGIAVKPAEAELKKTIKEDKDKLIRLNAVRALVAGYGISKPSLIPFLTERLKPEVESDFEVRVAIAEELGGMGQEGKPAVPALRAAQRDPQIKVREAATAALKTIEKPPMLPPKD